MSWSRALGEFGATIMFAGNIEGRTQTLPLVVYAEFAGGDLDASIAAAAILVLAAFGVLVAVRVLRWGRALDIRAAWPDGRYGPGSSAAGDAHSSSPASHSVLNRGAPWMETAAARPGRCS